MAKKALTQCQHCKDWFESRLINAEAYLNPSITIGENYEQCPHCGKMAIVSKDTIKLYP